MSIKISQLLFDCYSDAIRKYNYVNQIGRVRKTAFTPVIERRLRTQFDELCSEFNKKATDDLFRKYIMKRYELMKERIMDGWCSLPLKSRYIMFKNPNQLLKDEHVWEYQPGLTEVDFNNFFIEVDKVKYEQAYKHALQQRQKQNDEFLKDLLTSNNSKT